MDTEAIMCYPEKDQGNIINLKKLVYQKSEKISQNTDLLCQQGNLKFVIGDVISNYFWLILKITYCISLQLVSILK